MFKVSNKVPEVYMKESRDFQLLPRLDDLIFLGLHQDINTIQNLNNPKKCKDSYLNYLAEKVGFYTNEYIPDIVLINIISAFRTALKNKGTKLGIEQAVIAILKAENSIEPPKILYTYDESSNYYDRYTINIYTPIDIINKIALKEFLKYIIPTGFNYNIYTYENANIDSKITRLNHYDLISTLTTNVNNLGIIRSSNDIKKEDAIDKNNKSTKVKVASPNISNPYYIEDSEDETNLYIEDRIIGAIDTGVVYEPIVNDANIVEIKNNYDSEFKVKIDGENK